MRKLVALLFLFTAAPLAAQVTVTESVLTPEAAASIVAFYNQPTTTRFNGDTRVNPESDLIGNVAVLEGTLTLGGQVRGDLVVINGTLVVEQGARVGGTVTVVGGSLRNAEALNATSLTWYHERLKYELRDGELVLIRELRIEELSAGREFTFGRTDLLIAARGSYNRSEGLPVQFGPRLTLGHSNPTLIEPLFILRTGAGVDFDARDFGYAITIDQFLGGKRAARVGIRYAREVLPVETWGLSNREASLAAFVLHRDYRDHYEREGWSAYLAAGRRGLPLDWRIEYGNQRFRSVELRDPITLLYNDDAWRPELRVPDVRLHTLRTAADYDTRNEDRDPASGWLVRADIELALSLRSGIADDFDAHYRYGFLDARRYARLSPNARLGLRAVAAGSLNGEALPTFRQQSLGGEGSLPGYGLHNFDCDAHHVVADYAQGFGCDRLLLLQVEYQSNLRWLSRLGREVGRDFGLLENIKWVLFFDTGRTWNESAASGFRSAGTADFVADAGFGVRFGTLGVYWAVPLSARASGTNFFVRLRPRI